MNFLVIWKQLVLNNLEHRLLLKLKQNTKQTPKLQYNTKRIHQNELDLIKLFLRNSGEIKILISFFHYPISSSLTTLLSQKQL